MKNKHRKFYQLTHNECIRRERKGKHLVVFLRGQQDPVKVKHSGLTCVDHSGPVVPREHGLRLLGGTADDPGRERRHQSVAGRLGIDTTRQVGLLLPQQPPDTGCQPPSEPLFSPKADANTDRRLQVVAGADGTTRLATAQRIVLPVVVLHACSRVRHVSHSPHTIGARVPQASAPVVRTCMNFCSAPILLTDSWSRRKIMPRGHSE